MTARIYSNIATDNLRVYRGGEVGNGLSSNNYYHSEYTTASGELHPMDAYCSYQGPTDGDYNRLYQKLVRQVNEGGKGELLTAAVEWRKSLDMVTQRTLWLIDSYRHFRRFDLPSVVKSFATPVARCADTWHGVSTNRRNLRHGKAQSATGGWLEYWLGWAPAIGDIQNALDVLSREFPPQRISTAVRYSYLTQERFNSSWQKGILQCNREGSFGCYAKAKVTNYNLHLSNQLGLINPFTTGFQIIPFSFVLNWFINVEQMLNTLTDFAGVSLTETGIGIQETRDGLLARRDLDWHWTGTEWILKWTPHVGGIRGVTKFRIPGPLPSPRLIVQFDKLSLTRAATAVSLLVEVFLKK